MLSEVEYIKLLKARKNQGVVVEEQVIDKKHNWKTHLKHAWEHMKKSLIDVKDDTITLTKMRFASRPSRMLPADFLEYKRIQKDLMKFLPFSVFVIIPALEVILPFYLYLFPHATPSQFYSEKSIGEVIEKKVALQRRGYETLERKFGAILGEEYEALQGEIKRLRSLNLEPEALEARLEVIDAHMVWLLARKWKTASSKLGLLKLHVNELESCLAFAFKDFLSGVNLVNRVINLPFIFWGFSMKLLRKMIGQKQVLKDKNVTNPVEKGEKYQSLKRGKTFHGQFAFDWPLIRFIRKVVLACQIKHFFRQIRTEDSFMIKDPVTNLGTLSEQHLFEFSKRRGMDRSNRMREIRFLSQYWYSHKALGQQLEILMQNSKTPLAEADLDNISNNQDTYTTHSDNFNNTSNKSDSTVPENFNSQVKMKLGTGIETEVTYSQDILDERIEIGKRAREVLKLLDNEEFRFWVSVLRFKYAQYLV